MKRQRDAQERYERYLPTLQLKQQQLQLEVRQTESLLYRRRAEIGRIKEDMSAWIGILGDPGVDLVPWVRPKRITTSTANIAGVTIPTLKNVAFPAVDYDLFTTPLWVDSAVREIRNLVGLIAEADIIQEQFKLPEPGTSDHDAAGESLREGQDPECKENIRAIRIYLGDQDTNAVCRS